MMMNVTRDEKWQEYYNDPSNTKLTEDIRIKTANAFWRAKQRMLEIQAIKKAKSIKIITYTEIPKQVAANTSKIKKCQSLTMTGKPCTFKPTSECGRFCKKHCL